MGWFIDFIYQKIIIMPDPHTQDHVNLMHFNYNPQNKPCFLDSSHVLLVLQNKYYPCTFECATLILWSEFTKKISFMVKEIRICSLSDM